MVTLKKSLVLFMDAIIHKILICVNNFPLSFRKKVIISTIIIVISVRLFLDQAHPELLPGDSWE